MKKLIIVLCSMILCLFMSACSDTAPEPLNQADMYVPRIVDVVDLGCCVENITVRESALLGVNSVTHTSGNFIMTLNSDRKVYTTEDVINIWATLEYIGDGDTVEIWHGCPFMLFSISDGNDFRTEAWQFLIADLSVLQRGRVYHFDYQKSGGWDADAPDAEFWENFFNEPDLLLPAGEYRITLRGDFYIQGSASGLRCTLTITVKP